MIVTLGVFAGFGVVMGIVAHALRQRSRARFTVGTLVVVLCIGIGATWVTASLIAAHDKQPNAHYPCLSKAFPYVHSCRATADTALINLKPGASKDPVAGVRHAVNTQWNRLDDEQGRLRREWPAVALAGAGLTVGLAAFVAIGRRRVSMP